MNKKFILAIITMLFASPLAFATVASAQDTNTQGTTASHGGWQGQGGHGPMMGGMGKMAPGVFGTVASVSGNTITVTAKKFAPRGSATTTPQTTTTTTYTVDASNAKFTKGTNQSATIADIVVGDTIMVQGTVTGTNVVATMIRDGFPQMGKPGDKPQGTPPAPIITGNGQPVIGGNITAISGSTLTVTNKSNVTYSVDVSAATIVKGRATSTVSTLAVGDDVVVQGTVNGNSVAASSVMDQGAPKTSTDTNASKGGFHGFMQSVGGFFQHLFGFF